MPYYFLAFCSSLNILTHFSTLTNLLFVEMVHKSWKVFLIIESLCVPSMYSNESGRNCCFTYYIDKKMEDHRGKFLFQDLTTNKWFEPWGLNPVSCSRICALTPRTALGSFQETHPPPPSSVLPLSCYCLSCPASSSSWAVSSHLLAATGERSHCFSAKPVLHLHLTITLPAFLDTRFLIDTHIGFSMYQNDFKSIKILSDI